jgi:predicted nuclease of predicted toxin-antitoxin system
MLFKVDENLHDEIAELLRTRGHDSHTVHDEGLSGHSDLTLAERCRNESRVLITLDLDFADIRAYPPHSHAGIIVLRVGNQSRQHVLQVMEKVADRLSSSQPEGELWIVSEVGIRIRS